MKIRSGFVSNSSSSSFIVGVAEVTDESALNAYIAKHKLTLNYDFNILTLSDIKQNERWQVAYNNGRIRVSSFCADVFLNVEDKPDTTKIVYANFINDEGDYAFMSDDDDGSLNYDVGLDILPDEQINIYNIFTNVNAGVNPSTSSAFWGAGRNG